MLKNYFYEIMNIYNQYYSEIYLKGSINNKISEKQENYMTEKLIENNHTFSTDKNFIFRKKVDKTLLKSNLFTIPTNSESKLKESLGVTLNKGEPTIKINIEIFESTFEGRMFIANTEGNNALQISFNKDLGSLLSNSFSKSYTYITEEINKNPKARINIPSELAEYIDILSSDKQKTLRLIPYNDNDMEQNNFFNKNKKNYTREDALSDLFIKEDKFDKIHSILKSKKNLILQGSPGVGKTFGWCKTCNAIG